MIKNIVFDFGGVLVQYDFNAFFIKRGMPADHLPYFYEHVFTRPLSDELDLGLDTPQQIIDRTSRVWPEYSEYLQAYVSHFSDILTCETEGMRQLMLELKAKGYRLLGLSNWSDLIADAMRKFDIFSLLDDMVVSSHVKQIKPHADIYNTFLSQMGARPEECVFIDDRAENISGAQRCGLYGLVFKDVQQLRRQLRPLLQPYTFRKAEMSDLDACFAIVNLCGMEMEQKGRHQWTSSYPKRSMVQADIEQSRGYVVCQGNTPVAYTVITMEGEPAYDALSGHWLTTGPYATLHRTAVHPSHHGESLGRLLFMEAERLAIAHGMRSVRLDTNYDNVEMLSLAASQGYERCGLCCYTILGERAERIALEKPL